MKLKSELLSVLTESAVTFLIELLPPLLMITDGACGHCWPLSMLIDADKNFDGCCLSLVPRNRVLSLYLSLARIGAKLELVMWTEAGFHWCRCKC